MINKRLPLDALLILLIGLFLMGCQNGDSPSSFKDPRDGTVYPFIQIGQQTWMAENMRYETDTLWCYDDQPVRCEEYGALYHWNAAMKVCPEGWHLPTDGEWLQVQTHFGDNPFQALIDQLGLKMGGFRYADGYFVHEGQQGSYWTQSAFDKRRAWYYSLSAKKRKISRNYTPTTDALSCRCVKDVQ